VLFTVFTFRVPQAHAELDLQWHTLPGCPKAQDVRRQFNSLVNKTLETTGRLSAEGTIVRVGSRFSLTLVVQDGTALRTRVISSESCTAFAGAAAVTFALLLGVDVPGARPKSQKSGTDDSAPSARQDYPRERAQVNREEANKERLQRPDQPDTPSQKPRNEDQRPDEPDMPSQKPRNEDQRIDEPDNPAEKPEPSAVVPTVTTATPSRWGLVIRAPVVVADRGPLPSSTVGLGLGAGLHYHVWWITLTANFFTGKKSRNADPSGAYGADLNRVSGRLSFCRGWRSFGFELAPCVEVAIEHVTARGFGPGVTSRTERSLWPAPGVGVLGRWDFMESMALFLALQGFFELAQPRILIDGLGQVAQFKQAAVSVVTGMEWIF
jgi:hypothetical protein